MERERRQLLGMLRAHSPADAAEAADRDRMAEFVATHTDCRSRRCAPGHLTGSAYLIHPRGTGMLLIHHRKLDRWLQPGGHMADGESDPAATALREASEETGLVELAPIGTSPLDVDIHTIPARHRPDGTSEPAHDHLDWRYAFVVTDPESARACEDETKGLRWFAWDELESDQFDPAFQRAARKARRLLPSQ